MRPPSFPPTPTTCWRSSTPRAQTASTSLGGHVAAWEARAHIAEQTITRLDDVSSRTLPALQERTKEAEEQNQSLGRLVTEAVRMAASLTALQERLPAIGQCDQDLARIELAVPQIARQMEDLNATAERQIRALAVHQQRVRQTLDESQKTAAVVSELAGRVVDLSGSHQQLDRLEKCVTQLEQRAAAAVGEVRHATRAKDELQREIAKCQQQIERLTTAAHSEAEKVNGLRRHAEYHGGDRASSPSVHELLNTLRFRRPDTSRGFSPARVTFGGAAFALSAAIILLVGIVWRMSPVENQRAEKALRAPVPASRALTLAPTLAVVLPMPPTADISRDRPVAARTAPSVPAVPVPLVVVSQTAAAARGVPTAAVREQSVTKDAKTPPFVGTLLIESDPAGAAAFVNQKSVGETPVRLKDLRAGSYVVRLEHEGYQRWSTAATVSAVRQERVKAKLERERNRSEDSRRHAENSKKPLSQLSDKDLKDLHNRLNTEKNVRQLQAEGKRSAGKVIKDLNRSNSQLVALGLPSLAIVAKSAAKPALAVGAAVAGAIIARSAIQFLPDGKLPI